MRSGLNLNGAQCSSSRHTLCHLDQISLLERLFFTFCNFWTNQSTAIAFCAQCTRLRRCCLSDKCTGVKTRKDKQYLVSWLQILSCEYSYNIKGWCSFCLPLVGPPLPGRFVHFWVLLQAQYSTVTQEDILLMLLWVFFFIRRPTSSAFNGQRTIRLMIVITWFVRVSGLEWANRSA